MDLSPQIEALRDRMRNASSVKTVALAVGDSCIRIGFIGFEPRAEMYASLRRRMCGPAALPADAENFYVFSGSPAELAAFLPEEMTRATGRNVYRDERIRLIFSVEHELFSFYLPETRETFIWTGNDRIASDRFVTHPFFTELSWWAQRHGMLLLHSGAVGWQGRGVVIAGLSGSGKSTLSMTALAEGMDFVSDDYLLLGDGPAGKAARHIYSTGYLTEYTLGLLPEFSDKVIFRKDERNKYLIDLAAFEDRIADEVPVGAVIVPRISGVPEPVLTRSGAGKGLVNLIASSSAQNREVRNPAFFLRFMEMVRDLPVYEMQLSPDLRRNAQFLRQWISQSL